MLHCLAYFCSKKTPANLLEGVESFMPKILNLNRHRSFDGWVGIVIQ